MRRHRRNVHARPTRMHHHSAHTPTHSNTLTRARSWQRRLLSSRRRRRRHCQRVRQAQCTANNAHSAYTVRVPSIWKPLAARTVSPRSGMNRQRCGGEGCVYDLPITDVHKQHEHACTTSTHSVPSRAPATAPTARLVVRGRRPQQRASDPR
jgi:hypothetical protein